MALPATDDFNRANGAIGSNWTYVCGSSLSVASNALAGGGGFQSAFWNVDAFGNDHYSEATITSDNYPGLLTRAATAGGGRGIVAQVVAASGAIEWYRVSGGSPSGIRTYSSSPPTSGRFRLESIRDHHTLYHWSGSAWDYVDEVVDATYSDGSAGVWIQGGGGLDDWAGGDLTVATIGDNSTDDFSGCEDTQIREGSPTTNSGSGTQLEVTKYASGDHNHTLIKFSGLSNLAGFPVEAARLYFRVEGSGGLPNTVSARALLRSWVEGEATWNNYSTGNAWTSGGALSNGNDRASTVTVTGSVSATGSSLWFWIDVTADVQAIVAGGNNYGWHLERTDAQDDSAYIIINSSEDTDGRRPYLEVTYTVTPATTDQEGFRFGIDDGSESAHTWKGAQDAAVTHPLGTNLLLRTLIDAANDPSSAAYTLRYQKNGSGGYVDVPVGASITTPADYFGGASGGTTATTSTTITIPASLPAGCVLCLHFTSRDHASGTGQPTVSDNNGGASWIQRQFTTDRKAQWWWKRYEASLSSKTITISGAVGSLAARLVVIENVYDTGDPFTDFTEETNASGNETHAAISPTYAGSAVVFAVYNYANDNAVSSVSAATTGAPGQSTGRLSTGGSDCATHVAVWDNHPASTTGSLTWAQTNGTTYSHAYAVRPLVTNRELYVSSSANIADGGEATTARLTPPGAKTSGDFQAGRRLDDANGWTGDLTSDVYTELEHCLRAQSPAVNTDYFDFRVYKGGSALDTYGVTPRWTVGTPKGFPFKPRNAARAVITR